jgi:hypothetical protein
MWGTVLNGCFSNNGSKDSGEDDCALGGSASDIADNSNLTLRIDLDNRSAACSTATTFTLTYWEHSQGDFSNDMMHVYLNGTYQPTVSSFTSDEPAGWRQRTIDLTPLIGQQAEVVWSFSSTFGSNRAGTYIDDLSVTCQ